MTSQDKTPNAPDLNVIDNHFNPERFFQSLQLDEVDGKVQLPSRIHEMSLPQEIEILDWESPSEALELFYKALAYRLQNAHLEWEKSL